MQKIFLTLFSSFISSSPSSSPVLPGVHLGLRHTQERGKKQVSSTITWKEELVLVDFGVLM